VDTPKRAKVRAYGVLEATAEQEMKVFIAGATGAIGHPLISRLVASGHDVVGK